MKIENETSLDLKIEEEQPEVNILKWDDDDPNLVSTFSTSEKGQTELKRIAAKMKKTFDDEWLAQTDRREQEAEDWKTFIGYLKKKTFPFENCANVNVPISYENIIRLGFRIIGELFGDWTNVVGVAPLGPDDIEDAGLMSKHDNWQFSEQIADFPRQMEKGVFRYLLPGDVTCHSYYDPDLRSNRHEILTSDEFLVPNNVTSCQPDYSDSPFVCRIHYYADHQLYNKKKVWFGVSEILEKKNSTGSDLDESPMKVAHDETHGVTTPDTPVFTQHKILQWVGYMEMPGYERQRFVQGYLHHESGKLLQLSIHEQASFEEIERFNRQKEELDLYRNQMRQYTELANITLSAESNLIGNADIPDISKAEIGIGGNLPPPPLAPTWVNDPDDETEEPEPIRKQPVHQFEHCVLIEPQEGTLGYGFGRLVSDLNRAANILLDQYIDAGTVGNVTELITTSDVKFDIPFKSKPGAIHVAKNITGTELHSNIMVLPKGTANPQLRELVDTLVKWGQSAPQSPDILSGAPGKSGETFRGIATRSEHATKQLSVITRKFSRFVARIFKQNARLNAVFMDEKVFFSVNNHKLGTMENLEIGRSLYRRKYNVQFRSDMTFSSSSEKVQKADELVQMAITIPYLQQVPGFMKSVIVKALEARDEHLMADLVKNAQEPNMMQEQIQQEIK